MAKIAIITDSASDLPQDYVEKHHVKMLHFQIVYDNETYKDRLQITSKEVLATIAEKAPTTSLPSLQEMHEVFEQIQAEGYTHVLAITISSGLSGCHNAVSMVKEDYPDLETYVYDSKTLSIAEAILVKKAVELSEKGKEIPEIIETLDVSRKKQHTFFIVDTLKYLVAGGRIGHVSAIVGNILNLKPIITVGDDGKYVSYMTARGKNKALTQMLKEAKTILASKQCDVCFIHADGKEAMDQLYDGIKEETNIGQLERWDWISPVACVHTGPGFIAVLLQETC